MAVYNVQLHLNT